MAVQNKKIAVLTSGGDAPGMNACIRAVVRSGVYKGMDVIGVDHGYKGLIEGTFHQMDLPDVADIVQRGGTVLRTARCPEFKTPEGRLKAVEQMRKAGIDGLVAIGGDGTFQGAKLISDLGMPTIGIPGTIDNDLAYTDFTLGFDTAVNTVVDAINKLRDTMMSHDRVSVVEVMGRKCGDLSLYAGVAAGAQSILVPEIPVDLDNIMERIKRGQNRGKHASIIVVAEGLEYTSYQIASIVKERAKVDTKVTVLGHIQRGGSPSAADRVLATRMGVRAVELLENNIGGQVIGVHDNHIIHLDITEALSMNPRFDHELYRMSRLVSM